MKKKKKNKILTLMIKTTTAAVSHLILGSMIIKTVSTLSFIVYTHAPSTGAITTTIIIMKRRRKRTM